MAQASFAMGMIDAVDPLAPPRTTRRQERGRRALTKVSRVDGGGAALIAT